MTNFRTRALATIFAVMVLATGALGQGNLKERIHYTINVPQALEMSGYMLPAGKYLISQINTTDLNLFALYRGDDTKTPIASIRTTRVDYQPGEYPADAKIRLEIDETSADATPVLLGWSIQGQDGWKIIAVDADDDDFLKRVP
jgi:hypothetical protein